MAATSDRLILALDVSTATQARQIVTSVGPSVGLFKVGKQLFTAEGPQFVRELVASGKKVFLDLKYHDIPATVAGAAAEAARLGVSMLTVHASGGSKMLAAATQAAAAFPSKPIVLGVTVLTSFGQEDLDEVGVDAKLEDQVLRLAELAIQAGCGGVVASAREARAIRNALGADFAIVTPGVRLAGGSAGDQTRVVTPAQAISAGATHVVIGRPITEAKDPAKTVQVILAELSAA